MSTERIKAIATGTLSHIGINADCYVLSNGMRVLSQRGILRAIGVAETTGFDRGLARLPNASELIALPPIEFDLPGGGRALGRTDEWFLSMIKAYKTAWRTGLLRKSQEKLGMMADATLDALAGVGLSALIDEATGYEAIRGHGQLSRLFERLLLMNAAKWSRMWPEEVVSSLCGTYRIQKPTRGVPAPMMGVIGWIYELVLGSEVRQEVKRRNPRGKTREMHHQFFQGELRQLVAEDLIVIKALSDQSRDKEEFKRRMLAHYRKSAFQLDLPATE